MMAARSRFHNQSNDWDSMREEFNNSRYDAQYPDDDASGGVQLDHCRLYIRNIPSVLNEEGLRTAFSKYGTLKELFLSADPDKKYALVMYETPGEAKLAMTKLNRTEPLQLNINIAHKRKEKKFEKNPDREYHGSRKSNKEEVASVGSRGRSGKNIDLANGDNDVDDDVGGNEFEFAPMDPDLELELEQIKLKQLELQEEQVRCKQRLLLLKTSKRTSNVNTSTNRCILPDGRIVVRNVSERNLEPRDADASFGAGAGDSRVASRVCVSCGGDADAFCARCGVTPYCSARCQRRDWAARHQAVCHNLARLGLAAANDKASALSEEPEIPAAAPLRRPVSLSRPEDRQNEKVFTAPGQVKQPNNNSNNRGGRAYNNNNRDNNRENNNYNKKPYERRPQPKQPQEEEKCWEIGKNANRPDPKPESSETKPAPAPVKSQHVAEPKPSKSQANAANSSVANRAPANASVANRAPANVKTTPAAKLEEVTPAKKLVPKSYVIETLPIGSIALLSVDNVTSACATKKPGFVCLSMHEQVEADYQALCETYVVDCEADQTKFEPSPGDLFSYLSPEDSGWYRARSLGKGNAALIDSSKVIKLVASDSTKRLVGKYEAIPEYCCVLDAANVKIGDNLKCTLVAKTADGFKVSLENVETGAPVGDGSVCRWIPDVEYPPVVAAAPTTAVIPEVPRPDVVGTTKVFLVDITALDKAYVRPCDINSMRVYDQLLQDVYMHAAKASPLTEPPKKGDTVIGMFTDGCFYRALCKRTNVALNKYLIEYIDFGNVEIAQLENLYACPTEYNLSSKPTLVSLVKLQVSCGNALTPPATEYLDKLKDGNVELLMTLSSGAKAAPSGSAVSLTVVKTNESVNRKVEQFCTPEWKKMEDKGADVVESPKLLYENLTYLELPAAGCTIEVLDFSTFRAGTLCGHEQGTHVETALAQLTERMAEYCESEIGRQPYLPAVEELCIAKCPPYPQWFRAVVVEHSAGDPQAQVFYIDYGNVETIPVTLLRKMLPEFASQPALCVHIELKDFPEDVTDEMFARGLTHMKVTSEGRGVLTATRCERVDVGLYRVHAPGLLKAMTG